MQVHKLMTPWPGWVHPEDSLKRAAELMQRHACGCVPVVDEREHVVGVLTDRDVCLAALRSDQPISNLRCQGVMSQPAHICRTEDTTVEAERLMGLHRVRRLPVVDAEGRLAGVISLDDLAREARRGADLFVPHVGQSEVGRTLGEISRPALVVDGTAVPWPTLP
jgi:CBS-domain-containing membrane protein